MLWEVVGSAALIGAAGDIVDITAHKAQIFQFAVGQCREAFARDARIIPSGDPAEHFGQKTGGTEAGAEGAVRDNGHLAFPYGFIISAKR